MIETERVQVQGVNDEIQWKKLKVRRIPQHLPNLHFLALICGSRGSGKTMAMLKLMQLYDQARTFDKVYLFSPTYHNDPKYHALDKGEYRLEVIEEYSEEQLVDVIHDTKVDIERFKEHGEYRKAYTKLQKWKKDLSLFPMEELIILEKYGYVHPDEQCEWKQMPTTCIIFDDLMYSPLYKAKSVINGFAIKHRHYHTSLVFLTQGFKGGVPRQIRANLSLIILFATKSKAQREDIANEVSAWITPEHFEEIFSFATEEQHSFLLINGDEREKNHKFRKNFDEYIKIDYGKQGDSSKNGP